MRAGGAAALALVALAAHTAVPVDGALEVGHAELARRPLLRDLMEGAVGRAGQGAARGPVEVGLDGRLHRDRERREGANLFDEIVLVGDPEGHEFTLTLHSDDAATGDDVAAEFLEHVRALGTAVNLTGFTLRKLTTQRFLKK